MQVEGDNLDIVTKSALLGQENQFLKDKLETATQQMLHMQHEVCVLECLQCCSLFWLSSHCKIKRCFTCIHIWQRLLKVQLLA